MSKIAQRVTFGVLECAKMADVYPPEEKADVLCALMSSIRDNPEACERAELDPVGYMGEYLNEQARSGDAMRLCTLVKKLRAVNTADRATIRAFYLGMMEYDNGVKRFGVDVPDEDASPVDIVGSSFMTRKLKELEVRLRFVGLLEEETRSRVSASAADGLLQFANFLDAQIHCVKAFEKTGT